MCATVNSTVAAAPAGGGVPTLRMVNQYGFPVASPVLCPTASTARLAVAASANTFGCFPEVMFPLVIAVGQCYSGAPPALDPTPAVSVLSDSGQCNGTNSSYTTILNSGFNSVPVPFCGAANDTTFTLDAMPLWIPGGYFGAIGVSPPLYSFTASSDPFSNSWGGSLPCGYQGR